MILSELIITPLGIRGKTGKLTPNVALNFALAFGTYLGRGKTIIVARDTRITSRMYRNEVINGLMSVGINVLNMGIAPTPCLIYNVKNFKADGGVMITGSHIPEDWNGLKFIDGRTKTYITEDVLNQIMKLYNSKKFNYVDYENLGKIKKHDGVTSYINGILKQINLGVIKKRKFNVILDPVAGCGLTVTPQLFLRMRCKTRIINDSLNKSCPYFPRGIEPTPENLTELSKIVRESGADIGFAHDLDADRVVIAENDTGRILEEDIGLALIIKDYLENKKPNDTHLVVNVASSRIFYDLAKKYGAIYEEVPVGEIYITTRLRELVKNKIDAIGGEGSCGGIVFPEFNNTRDGPMACAKILEIMAKNKCSISELVKKLPKYFMKKMKITCPGNKYELIIEFLKEKYPNYELKTIDGAKFINKSRWFLIRPSKTEPIIRIFVETDKEKKTDHLANEIMGYISKILEETSKSLEN